MSASASFPAAMAHSSVCSSVAPASAALCRRLDARRDTVSMVPSAGFMTALYAASTPSLSAPANSTAPAVSMPLRRFAMPRNSSDSITPELPRAPRSSPDETQSAALSMDVKLRFQLVGGVVEREAHIRAGVAVRHRENVQLVYLLYICVERRVRAQYHLFERGGVDIIFQVKVPPGAYPIIVSI